MFMIINEKTMRRNGQGSGFSTIELLIYATGMVLILSVIFYMVVNMYDFYRKLTVEPRIDRIGSVVIDRITKDIRSGLFINLSESQFESNTGNITINSEYGSDNLVKRFNYDEGRITYQEDSGQISYLTPADISVSRFHFRYLETPISEAVRIELDITYSFKGPVQTKRFTGFAILKHSYE